MLDDLLQPEVQQFIKEHEHADIASLLLKGGDVCGIPLKRIAEQINGRNKAKKKLPVWYDTSGIIYPAKRSMEQCSSEHTAQYKASIVKGERMADLTGGAGVDTYYFCQNFKSAEYVDQDANLFELCHHNFAKLKASNIRAHLMTAEQFLSSNKDRFDLIYLDPARRDNADKKVFKFDDCSPDVNALLPTLIQCSKYTMIKTAPFLDITQALQQLHHVIEVHIVAVDNECKEVLYLLSQEHSSGETIVVKTINLSDTKGHQSFDFEWGVSSDRSIRYSLPDMYIYEPNSAIMKSGGVDQVGTRYGLKKLHPHSQLLTGDALIAAFPGRAFEIIEALKYERKAIRKAIPSGKANITTRNFPDTVAQIRKKTGLRDGGTEYLFATTNSNEEKVILRTRKVVS